jgi:hypothetical protein
MPLCGRHPARQCVCSYALVKMRPGTNRRVKIDTFLQRYKLSPVDLQENWPALLSQMQQAGNSVFNPILYFSNQFAGPRDAQIESSAWDYITTRCRILERQSRFGNVPPIIGRDSENEVYLAFKDLQELWNLCLVPGLLNVWNFFQSKFQDFQDVLGRICTRLGVGGYEKGLYVEVLEMGRIFAPFVAEVAEYGFVDPQIMWSFLESFYKLTAPMGLQVVDKTLEEVLFATTSRQRIWIETVAWTMLQNQNSYLAQCVLLILT